MGGNTATRDFRSAGLITVGLQGAALVSNIVLLAVLTRRMGAEQFGAYMLLLASGQILAALSSMGLAGVTPFALGRLLASPTSLLRSNWTVVVLIGSLVAGTSSLTGLAQAYLPAIANVWAILGFAIAFALASFYSRFALCVNRVLLSSAIISLPPFLVLAAALILSSQRTLTPQNMFAAYAAALWGTVGGSHYLLRADFRKAKNQTDLQLKLLIRKAGLGYASALLGLLAMRLDLFLVSKLAGLAQVGLYSFGVQLAEMAVRAPGFLSTLLGPRAAADPEETARLALRVARVNLLLAGACFAPLVLAPNTLSQVLEQFFGIAFSESAGLVLYLTPRVLCLASSSALAGYLVGHGFTKYHPLASVAAVLISGTLDFLLVPTSGAKGAAIASSAGYFVASLVLLEGFRVTAGYRFGELFRSATSPPTSPPR